MCGVACGCVGVCGVGVFGWVWLRLGVCVGTGEVLGVCVEWMGVCGVGVFGVSVVSFGGVLGEGVCLVFMYVGVTSII